MIVVRVELHSARTGEQTELARMHICNDGSGTHARRNYLATALRGRKKSQLDAGVAQRAGTVTNFPSPRVHVWNLVAEALVDMGYGYARDRHADQA